MDSKLTVAEIFSDIAQPETASTLSWLAGVAIYALWHPATDELAEVFA